MTMRSTATLGVAVVAASVFIIGCSSGGTTAPGGTNPGGGGTSGGTTPPADTPPGPTGGQTPPVDTSLGTCRLFPADYSLATPIDDPVKFPVHSKWAEWKANMALESGLQPDFGTWSTDHIGIPWQVVPADTPRVPVTFRFAEESDPGPYPIPDGVRTETNGGHMLLVDRSSCSLFELWNATKAEGGWTAGAGVIWDLRASPNRTKGFTSADAAGLPILPHLLKVSEVKAGSIDHAIRFTMSRTQHAYIPPATHATGTSTDANLPPFGLRMRLRADFDVSYYEGPMKVILVAMKKYGLVLADVGADWFITGDSDDAWEPYMEDIYDGFRSLRGSDFEAVESGPITNEGLWQL